MQQDEIGTLRALRASRAILDRLIADYRGRIFTTAGDSVLADFARAAGARRGSETRQRRVALGVAAAAVVIALVGAGLWVSPVPLPVEPQRAATPPAVSPSEPGVTSRLPAPRLSIVVLPFANLSND